MAEQTLQDKLGLGSKKSFQYSSDEYGLEDYQAFSFGRVGTRSRAMICFIKSDGFHLALPYIELHAIRTSSPDEGFDLDMGTHRISVKGRGLSVPFRYIREHRLAELSEATRATVLSLPESESIVERIDIVSLARE